MSARTPEDTVHYTVHRLHDPDPDPATTPQRVCMLLSLARELSHGLLKTSLVHSLYSWFSHPSGNAWQCLCVPSHAYTSPACCFQELEQQDEPRPPCPPATDAVLLSPTTAETTTQGSSGTLSRSDMMPDLGMSQQVLGIFKCRL